MKPEIYKELAASGRFVNTGKVLIGLQYVPRQRRVMSRDEERLQTVLLGIKVPSLRYDTTIYALYLIGVMLLICALAEIIK